MGMTDTETAHSQRNTEWLTMKEASGFLGIHVSTLRAWADRGEVKVFRTPGGHRRFSVEDLRRFLEVRGHPSNVESTTAVMESALVRVRQELERTSPGQMQWRGGFHDGADDERRQRGRKLFSLALAYVMKPALRQHTMDEGRELGRAYGGDAARNGVSLAESGRAVQFFRAQLGQSLHSYEAGALPDADDLRIQSLLDHFLDEVLYAVLDGYERGLQRASDAGTRLTG
jgi:excisionase family DNA binding protein